MPKLQNLRLLKESESKGCHFTPSPPYQLSGPSPAVYCSFGLGRARRSRVCCLHRGSGRVCTGEGWQLSQKLFLWPPILFPVSSSGAASVGRLAPVGRPFFPQQHSILHVLLRSFESGLPKLLIALQACQMGLLDFLPFTLLPLFLEAQSFTFAQTLTAFPSVIFLASSIR